jgi:hypothetical protein
MKIVRSRKIFIDFEPSVDLTGGNTTIPAPRGGCA